MFEECVQPLLGRQTLRLCEQRPPGLLREFRLHGRIPPEPYPLLSYAARISVKAGRSLAEMKQVGRDAEI